VALGQKQQQQKEGDQKVIIIFFEKINVFGVESYTVF
jgi:hypothetical protein